MNARRLVLHVAIALVPAMAGLAIAAALVGLVCREPGPPTEVCEPTQVINWDGTPYVPGE
jgi:hypothetical protein